MDKINVAVLGATGLVGQKMVEILSKHPWFRISYLGASESKRGLRYMETVKWRFSEYLPDEIVDMRLGGTRPDEIPGNIDIVFSALPSSVAAEVEIELARLGFIIVSNASPLRLERDIPLINPEVNPHHLKLAKLQEARGWKGRILKNPNCTAAILTLSLAPLREYGIKEVIVTTMQAISGAGLRGVPGYEIVDNIIPFIESEEDKIIDETRKILGETTSNGYRPAETIVSATATRVPVLDGHLESVHVRLGKPVDIDDVTSSMEKFVSKPQKLGLPTAPPQPVIVNRYPDRPQPRLDRNAGNGMSVVVGRLEKPRLFDKEWLKYLVLGHNLIRGAAGIAVLVAELYVKEEGLV